MDLFWKIRRGKKILASGRGRTVAVSSKSITFESDEAVPRAKHIELRINWPARIGYGTHLQLVIAGTLASYDTENQTGVVEILKYEFRTRAAPENELDTGDGNGRK